MMYSKHLRTKRGRHAMKEFCDNQYCENPGAKMVPVSIQKASDEKRTLCVACEEAYTMGLQHATKVAQAARPPGLLVTPPPRETVGQPLFRVTYLIDMNAASAIRAARQTHQILIDPDSQPPVVDVMDHRGRVKRIDLSLYALRATQVHPALQKIHDLLYMDIQSGRETYDPDKRWDADTLERIAYVIPQYIPRPTRRRAHYDR